jgi:predicted metal-dependent enzyme (double-stranded beta helix superfamily)
MDDPPAIPLGQKLLVENDRVRVWEMTLAPGEHSGVHRHDLDYLTVILEGDRVAADGASPESKYQGRFEVDVHPGLVHFVDRGGVEDAVNTGTVPYREILIELKDQAPPG